MRQWAHGWVRSSRRRLRFPSVVIVAPGPTDVVGVPFDAHAISSRRPSDEADDQVKEDRGGHVDSDKRSQPQPSPLRASRNEIKGNARLNGWGGRGIFAA